MMKKTGVLTVLVVAGLAIGFIWGALLSFWAFELFLLRKDSETHSLYVSANACIALKSIDKPAELTKLLEQQLESGLLALACDDRKTLSVDNMHLLSVIKDYMAEHPIRYSNADSQGKIAALLSSIPAN